MTEVVTSDQRPPGVGISHSRSRSVAIGICGAMVAISLVLLLLAVGNPAYTPRLGHDFLVMALIGAGLQWVAVLLACEQAATAQLRAGPYPGRLRLRRRLIGRWLNERWLNERWLNEQSPVKPPRPITVVSVVLSVGLLVTFVVLCRPGAHPGPARSVGYVVASQLLVFAMLRWAWVAGRAADVEHRNPPALAEPDAGLSHPAHVRDGVAHGPVREIPNVIAMSGGGIRAAAFVLGGLQAIQDEARLEPVDPPEPMLVAVSGGSYVAAATALTRTFAVEDSRVSASSEKKRARRDQPLPWHEVYRIDDPETALLRRHTRYLFDPRRQTYDGLIQLLTGAVVNLVMVSAVLLLVVWLSAALAVATGYVGIVKTATDHLPVLAMGPGISGWHWWLIFAPALLGIAVPFVLALVGSAIRGSLDNRKQRQFESDRRFSPATLVTWRVSLAQAGAVWVLVIVLLPAAAFGMGWLARTNTPTSSAATVLGHMGFTQERLCRTSLVTSAEAAYHRAAHRALLNPRQAQTGTAGACGVTTDVTVTYDGTHLPPADLAPEARTAASRLAVDKVPGGASLGVQIGTVAGLVSLMAGLIRRLGAADPATPESWWARYRRRLATWLPLATMTALFAWLALAWMYHFLVDPSWLECTWLGLVILGLVGVGGVAMDANTLSLNVFYRRRLASAFAVGRVDVATATATELPERPIYSFSELQYADGRAVQVRIVTTANAHRPEETAAGRGGVPMVFGPEYVGLYCDENPKLVPTGDYEKFAGLGRVSVMSTVSVSGAAISPLMGRFANRMAPYRILLALLNVRVGQWVHNPRRYEPPLPWPDASRLAWSTLGRWFTDPMTRRPGAMQVVAEAFGQSSIDDQWIYLSDGGHLDNTGLVESVRLCRNAIETSGSPELKGDILVLDASNDVPGTWSAVGDAIAVIRADLHIDLRLTTSAGAPPWVRTFAAFERDPQGGGMTPADLRVTVVKAVRVDASDPAAAAWESQLPADVRSFQAVHPDFPRSSTGRQEFGDIEFEAYRSLGYAFTAHRR